MKRWKSWILIVLAIILVSTNLAFYLTTRSQLIADQKENVQRAVSTVRTSVETTQRGEILFEAQLADQLRLLSMQIQKDLPHDINDVTNEQLVAETKKLGIEGITLFMPIDGDFEGVKSSDPKEIGLKSGTWGDGKWNQMFEQLMTVHNVTPIPNFGENLPNFWSGQMDTSSADSKSIEKWGYYNDGTTNYLIDPYINDTSVVQFQHEAGANKAIEELIANDPAILEIAVINNKILMDQIAGQKNKYANWYSERLVQYGTYNFRDDHDVDMIQKAFETNKMTQKVAKINGKSVLNSVVPIELSTNVAKGYDQISILVYSDYSLIKTSLFHQETKMALISILLFILGFVTIFLVTRHIERQNKTITTVQEMYTSNIQTLFNTVREHRHDFNNHVLAMQGYLSMGKTEELKTYLNNLAQSQKKIFDLITINIPAFSGLLHAKVAQASEKQIIFEHQFEGFENNNIDTLKVSDLVRIVGNIVDNAFEAVLSNEEDNRKVGLIGKMSDRTLTFKVFNNGPAIKDIEAIFVHGYSTKLEKGNSGLGLAIVKKLISDYKGNIEVTSDSEMTIFTITIPLSVRETGQAA